MKIARISVAVAALVGGGLGLAAPASADLVPGNYDVKIIDGQGAFKDGQVKPATATSCGPDCLSFTGALSYTFHQQGNAWVSVDNMGCTFSIDNATLGLTDTCPGYQPVIMQFTKVG